MAARLAKASFSAMGPWIRTTSHPVNGSTIATANSSAMKGREEPCGGVATS